MRLAHTALFHQISLFFFFLQTAQKKMTEEGEDREGRRIEKEGEGRNREGKTLGKDEGQRKAKKEKIRG